MRRLLGVSIVAAAAFGWAAWERGRGAALIAWRVDAAAQARDAEQLGGMLRRMPQPVRRAQGPDVVVIVLDTVRADHLGAYGYDRGTTPRLDAWAAGARVYDRMSSDAAWTLPSHASLFTGRPPIAHGAHGVPADSEQVASPLAPGAETVARSLSRAGWRTMGIAANEAFLDAAWGLDQGFDLWLCEQLGADARRTPYATADRVTAMAIQALSREADAPRFLFLNYMDAHAPYLPREGYVRDPDAIDRRVTPYGAGWKGIAQRVVGEREPVSEEVRRAWVEAYDAELRYLDEHVGALLERLPELGVGEEDWVFVLADHGEYLGEHDLVEHSKDLYEEVLHVPLLVRGPGVSPGRDARPVQTHDVASMVLEAAGVAPLPKAVRTEALQVAELYWSRHRDLRYAAFRERFDRVRRAFRVGDRKLIVGPPGTEEAYDLAADPREARPVTGEPWIPELRAAGEAWLAAQEEAPLAAMGREADVEALRALGYVE